MKIALALGGGGTRGIAHVGVIRALLEAGFQFGAITGTSAGALVGALVAAGCSPQEILGLFAGLDQNRMFGRHSQDGPALMGMSGIHHVLHKVLDDFTFSDLKIPFACTSVDIKTAQEVVLHEGCVLESILASSAMPGVFPPQQIGDYRLIDGGILDPVPVEAARWLAPHLPIVAVVLSPLPEQWTKIDYTQIPHNRAIPAIIADQMSRTRLAQAFQIFVDSVDITARMLTELRLKADQPDVILRPDVSKIPILGQVDPFQVADIGEEEARNHLAEIRRATYWTYPIFRKFYKTTHPGEIIPVKGSVSHGT
jgi:NTE family protein